ncbi:hypothetical protein [Saccharomonospora xinjiangensis]|nr:hypothetical protein [Saccharomonospora xinjiangensis]
MESSARLWTPPPSVAVTRTPAGSREATGVLLDVVVPLPSWP